jgi:hypothetical protein
MSRFGWAYVNDVITGSGGTPGGTDKAIQFASGSTFSGSTNFTFDYTTNIVRLTGTLYADNLIVSSSTIFKSGSTKFGDDPTDTHQFTGSVLVSGSLTATNTITASFITASNKLEVGSNATIGGNILGSGALKAGYATYTGSFTVPTSAYFVGMSTTGSVLTASLGSAITYPQGQTLILKDVGGYTGTNNILIKASGSETIDGASGVSLTANSSSVSIISNGSNGFYIVGIV